MKRENFERACSIEQHLKNYEMIIDDLNSSAYRIVIQSKAYQNIHVMSVEEGTTRAYIKNLITLYENKVNELLTELETL